MRYSSRVFLISVLAEVSSFPNPTQGVCPVKNEPSSDTIWMIVCLGIAFKETSDSVEDQKTTTLEAWKKRFSIPVDLISCTTREMVEYKKNGVQFQIMPSAEKRAREMLSALSATGHLRPDPNAVFWILAPKDQLIIPVANC